jgi:(S)-ureidoglycine aminohydrolase
VRVFFFLFSLSPLPPTLSHLPPPLLSSLSDLPGFTRSVVAADHALITPESRTWAPLPGWTNGTAAVLISPAPPLRAGFSMFFARLGAGGVAGPALAGGGEGAGRARARVQRLVYVLDGSVEVTGGGGGGGACPGLEQAVGGSHPLTLHADGFVYLPPGCASASTGTVRLSSPHGAGLLVWEKLYSLGGADGGSGDGESGSSAGPPPFLWGAAASALPALDPGGGETFALRKLLPPPSALHIPDFNIHVMDFEPGQYLVTKEVHHNQHGLVLLEGKGIYRLGASFYPVTAGDAIFMAPYVPQWFGALGEGRARYIIFKDVGADPLLPPGGGGSGGGGTGEL